MAEEASGGRSETTVDHGTRRTRESFGDVAKILLLQVAVRAARSAGEWLLMGEARREPRA